MIRLVIADDHPLVRSGLAAILGVPITRQPAFNISELVREDDDPAA